MAALHSWPSSAPVSSSGRPSIVIGAFMPMAAVTVFAIASGLIDYARALVAGIRTTLAPRASALEGRGQGEALRDLVLDGARYCTLLVLPIAVTFALRGSSFIGLWMGPAYGGPSGAVLAILAGRLVVLGATGAAGNVMLGASRERAVAVLYVAEAAVNVTAMLLLVRSAGLVGVAWATTVPTVVAALLVWPWLLRRSFGVSVRGYLSSAWGRPVVAMLPFAGGDWTRRAAVAGDEPGGVLRTGGGADAAGPPRMLVRRAPGPGAPALS